MVAKEISVNVKTKNTSKYNYFLGFLLFLKIRNLQTIETPKNARSSKGLELNFLLMQER